MTDILCSDPGRQILEEALTCYGLSDSDTTLIRHNENRTYCVDGKYLLRIHKHKDGFTTDPLYEGFDRTELYRSELSFLAYLKKCDMHVQTPVRNKKGCLVTLLRDGTPATVLTWLEGHTVDKNELSPALCRKIGAMTAKLHLASRNFPPVSSIRYDGRMCVRLARKLTDLSKSGLIVSVRYEVLNAALNIIGDFLHAAENEFILVHSDLSLSNMLITESGLAPIDFSLSGYSHPMMDIGCLYCVVSGSVHRHAIAEGYETASDRKIDFYAVDCLFALNVLLGIILHWESWTKEDWFAKKLADWCDHIFGPLAQGKSLIDLSVRAGFAGKEDVDRWLTLVNMVADDFPGLDREDYTETLKKNIARKTALCVKEDGKIVGALLFSPNQHCLSCMAVHPDYRRYGIASALIAEMLRLMPEGDVSVTTFREGDPKGNAPRALYQRFGFEPDKLLTEFNYPAQKFVLKRKEKRNIS